MPSPLAHRPNTSVKPSPCPWLLSSFPHSFFLLPLDPLLSSLPTDCSSTASPQSPPRRSYCATGCSSCHAASARPLLRCLPALAPPSLAALGVAAAVCLRHLDRAATPNYKPAAHPGSLSCASRHPSRWSRCALGCAAPLSLLTPHCCRRPTPPSCARVAMLRPRRHAIASCLGPACLGSALPPAVPPSAISALRCRCRLLGAARVAAHGAAPHAPSTPVTSAHHADCTRAAAPCQRRALATLGKLSSGALGRGAAPRRPGHATGPCPSCMHALLGYAALPHSARPRSRVTEPPRRSSRPRLTLGLAKPPHAPQRPRRHRQCSSPSMPPSSRPQCLYLFLPSSS